MTVTVEARDGCTPELPFLALRDDSSIGEASPCIRIEHEVARVNIACTPPKIAYNEAQHSCCRVDVENS